MASSYNSDFFAWTVETAAKIRERRFDEIELAALAEEIEDLGKNTRRALESRMEVLIAHLLKWKYQPADRSMSRQATVEEQPAENSQAAEGEPEPPALAR